MATILVVDDSASDQDLAGQCVKDSGADAVFARHGREALEIVERDHPDAVLTDLRMPEMDGLELVKRLAESHPNIPCVLMTAHGSEQIAIDALRAGATSYVPKDNLIRNLGDALKTVLEAAEATRQRDQVRMLLRESLSRFTLGFETDGARALISYIQDVMRALNFCDDSTLLRIATALSEAITNAVEHGNLELESTLRESGDDGAYHRLGQERVTQLPYCQRRVFITATLTQLEARFVIRDEGLGFDPSTLPDPTDPEHLLRPSGRGIMLMRTFMDDISFNERGNEVTMLKCRAD